MIVKYKFYIMVKRFPIMISSYKKRKFVKLPIGLITCIVYSGSDKHSLETLQWLSFLQKQWTDFRKKHYHSTCKVTFRWKIAIQSGKRKNIRYEWDVYFEYDGQKYACEYYKVVESNWMLPYTWQYCRLSSHLVYTMTIREFWVCIYKYTFN